MSYFGCHLSASGGYRAMVKTAREIGADTFVKIANALHLSADALLQDVVTPVTDSITAELSVRIGRLPQKEQNRILNAIRALTE